VRLRPETASYRREKSLYEIGFSTGTDSRWIDCHNHFRQHALATFGGAKDPSGLSGDRLQTSRPRRAWAIDWEWPEQCWFEEVFNSDSSFYAGSNLGKRTKAWMAERIKATAGRPSIRINFPPLGVQHLQARDGRGKAMDWLCRIPMPPSEPDAWANRMRRSFAATRWTLVLAAAPGLCPRPARADAMAELCRAYWYPLYVYVPPPGGMDTHEAEDLTQEFFLRLLAKHYLADVAPEKGKVPARSCWPR